jgi:hypothetical protein
VKFIIEGKFRIEYEPDPQHYPIPGDVEDMLRTDIENAREYPQEMFILDDDAEFEVTGRVVE